MTGEIEVALLGPVEVRLGGHPVAITGVPQRVLLARLALSPGRPVPVTELIDALWVNEPPPNTSRNLHSYVSRLRRLIGTSLVTSDAAGYRLHITPERVDVGRVELLVAEGRSVAATDPAKAAGRLAQALDTWRGEPLADLPDPLPFAPTLARFTEWRQHLREEWFSLRLAAGHAAAAIADLAEASAVTPLREPVHLLLMQALHQAHRTPESLEVADAFRRRTAQESGLDPSAAFEDLHRRILGDDPALRPASPKPAVAVRRRPPGDRFVGRDQELDLVTRGVSAHRLVSVVGPGGIGKTRLVLEALDRLPAPDHVCLVELAEVSPTADIPSVVAGALGLRSAPAGVEAAIADLLAPAPPLLVLDNCEHVLEATRRFLNSLLPRCPGLRVLTTSRQRLGLPAERIVRLGQLTETEQVELFCDRAQMLRPDFDASPKPRELAADICRTLDGLPLAVELAARREAVFGLTQLRDRLSAGLQVLEPARDGNRSTAVTATVEWSYQLLDPDARVLFDRLVACRGGFPLDALRHLCPPDQGEPTALLAELVEASLVLADHSTVPTRYRLLEVMRRVGESHLSPSELVRVRDAHARWIGAEVEQLAQRKCGDGTAGGERLDREIANIREAVGWLIDSRQWKAAAGIGVMLGLLLSDEPLLDLCGQLRLLEPPTPTATDVDSQRAIAAGVAAWIRGDNAAAELLLTAALTQLPDNHPHRWVGHFIRVMNGVLASDADAVEADTRTLLGSPGVSRWVAANAVCAAVLVNLFRGNRERAEQWSARERSLLDEAGQVDGFIAYTRGELAAVSDPRRALAHFEQAYRQCDEQGHTYDREVARIGLAAVLIRLKRHKEAARSCRDLLSTLRGMGMWPQVWTVLRLTAELLVDLDACEPAAALLTAADADTLAPPILGDERDRHKTMWAAITQRLTPDQLAAAQLAGPAGGRIVAVETGRHALEPHCR